MDDQAPKPGLKPDSPDGEGCANITDELHALQACIAYAPISIFRLDKLGKIIEVNQCACDGLGYTRDELLSMSVFDLDPSLTDEMWVEHRKTLTTQGSRKLEGVHRRKDGSTFPVEVTINMYKFKGVPYSYSFVQDISERKRNEEALRTSENRFRNLADASFEGLALSKRGICVDLNDQLARMLGYTREELLGSPVIACVAPQDRQNAAKFILSGSLEPSVHIALCKDGRQYPMLIRSKTMQIDGEEIRVTVLRDISEQIQAEENNKRLLRLEREAMQVARLGYWEFDVASGLFTFNDQYYALHGTTAEQAGGYQMTAPHFAQHYVHPDDAPTVQDCIQRALDTTDPDFSVQMEKRILKVTGEVVDIIVWFRIEKDAAGKTVKLFGVNQDITERKQVENALRESEFFLRKSQEVGDLGSYYFNARTGTWICSEKMDELFGIDKSYLKTIESWIDLIHPDHKAEMLAHLTDDVITQHRRFDKEYRIIRRNDGAVRWVHGLGELEFDEAGNTLRMIGTIQDITRRKQDEEALQRSEERIRLALEATSDAIWDCDLLANKVYLSPRYYTMLGYEPDEFPATFENWKGLIHPENLDGVMQMMYEVIDHGGGFSAEFQMKKKNGDWCWALARGKVVQSDKNGKAIRIAGSNSDITERKVAQLALQQNEAQVRLLNEELEKRVNERTAQLQNANKELEAFAYSVSHDLRAPLRAINGYTRILIEDYGPLLDEEGLRVCGVITSEGNRMGQLIDDLLEFSRLGRAEMNKEPVDMNAMVIRIFREMAATEDKGRILFNKADLARAEADPNLLRQVWINLLSNALKFTRNCPVAEIEVGSRREGDKILYWVRDNGAGFDMRFQQKLFRVFQRLHSASEFDGTGVGLAIVHRIINRHGGEVWAVGEVGQGATFSFTLPTP